jgi:hypothetical protein
MRVGAGLAALAFFCFFMLTGPAIDARDFVLDSSKQIEQVVTKLDSNEGSDLFFFF